MAWYYPECDGRLFNEELPLENFKSDKAAVEHYQSKYGTLLMAVIKDSDPKLTVVYERGK